MIGRDVSLPRSALGNPAFRYVALGHIHKHQSLNRGAQPPVIYSGSIERIDFGEEFEHKGFVVAEIGPAETTWEFKTGYRREARPFVTIRVDVREETAPTEAVLAAVQAKGDLSQAVVRVIVKLKQEQEALLNERTIMHALEESAYYVAVLQHEAVRTERQRLGGVSVEALTPTQLLDRYLQVKEVPAERAARLLQVGETVIKTVDEGQS